METLEELKAIIAGKPEGATIIDIEADGNIDYLYFDEDGENGEMLKSCATKEDAAIAFTDGNIRSLSDIERIIELMEATQGMLQNLAGSPDGYWRNEIKAARKALGYE